VNNRRLKTFWIHNAPNLKVLRIQRVLPVHLLVQWKASQMRKAMKKIYNIRRLLKLQNKYGK